MNISNSYRDYFGIYQQQNMVKTQSENQGMKENGLNEEIDQSAKDAYLKRMTENAGTKEVDGKHSVNSYSQDSVLNAYQEICRQFPEVSFRLDDEEEAIKYQAVNGVNCCPYMGYQNSMNQIGEFFGEKDQKSVELDVSVIKKSMEDKEYQKKLLKELDSQMRDYGNWVSKADEQGVSHLCISIRDENDSMQSMGNYSNYPFSTEDQLKMVWSEQASIERLMNQGEKMRGILFGE